MFDQEQDMETPTPETHSQESTPSKHRNRWRAISVVNVVIILIALFLIFVLWPDKPAWLNASPLMGWIQPINAILKTPSAFSIAEISPEAADTVQFIDDQPSITPAPTLALASPTPPKTITPAPTSQPPAVKITPSVSSAQYKPQEGSPFYISAKPFQGAEQGCNWIGIAGQAFDAKAAPQNNLVVVVDGKLGDKDINLTTTTGSALLYGPAGYEIGISLKPQDSEGTLTIQLFHELGRPLSSKVPFSTSTSCEKNLAIVNFVESN